MWVGEATNSFLFLHYLYYLTFGMLTVYDYTLDLLAI